MQNKKLYLVYNVIVVLDRELYIMLIHWNWESIKGDIYLWQIDCATLSANIQICSISNLNNHDRQTFYGLFYLFWKSISQGHTVNDYSPYSCMSQDTPWMDKIQKSITEKSNIFWYFDKRGEHWVHCFINYY